MPLGKYYCDFCDKQFQDTPSARKRHLQGIQHQRARTLWYDSFKDPHRIQPEGFGKGVCNHFVRTGFCQYGDGCKYFHPKQNIQNPTQAISETMQSPIILGNQLLAGGAPLGDAVRDYTRISLGNLPPSLRPPPEGGYPSPSFVDWG
ncbi:C2H2 and C2HC zinc fingers superfamily protein isoform X2 [Tasmannia lanceolata]|uniref:C2H2 and C2HC zinc fingers superfamily protein isoform X2 n=1 Tax=Tasmannia lanceolata TaxID=3420 RepID=UPI0040637011